MNPIKAYQNMNDLKFDNVDVEYDFTFRTHVQFIQIEIVISNYYVT